MALEAVIFLNHTIRENAIPALADSWISNTYSVNIFYPQNIASPYIFAKYDVRVCWSFKDVSSLLFLL
jgi:hypothetical protein